MENKITVTVGASRKLNRQAHGGAAYESSDCWISISKDLPADVSHETIETQTHYLQKTADELLADEVKKTIKLIPPPPVEVKAASSHPTSSKAPAPLSVAPVASQRANQTPCRNAACNRTTPTMGGLCYICDKAVRGGAKIAEARVPVPDTQDGRPF